MLYMNHFRILGVLGLLSIPSVIHADQNIQTLARGLMDFIMSIVVPLLLAIALFFFVINVIRYFIIETDDVSKRANAKNLALYGVMAFVIILIFWGLVNILVASVGLGGEDPITPDYIRESMDSGPENSIHLVKGYQ